MRRTAVVIRGAAVRHARRKEIARPYILYGTGQSSRPCRHPAFPLSHPAKWVPTMLPALGRCSIRHRIPFPGLDATVLVVSCLPLAPRPCGMGVPAASGAIGRPARVADQRPARLRQSCPSAPGYGARRLLPGRLLDGHRPDACRHPLSIPFDGCCPYPLDPSQLLDSKKRAVLSPVCNDRLSPSGPYVRQSLLQHRRIGGIDVDPVRRMGRPHQQHSQHQRLPRNPRPHRETPCDLETVPADIPFGQNSVPRHIHTAYRPLHLHAAGQIPDVM